jgi:hypothetical protein
LKLIVWINIHFLNAERSFVVVSVIILVEDFLFDETHEHLKYRPAKETGRSLQVGVRPFNIEE